MGPLALAPAYGSHNPFSVSAASHAFSGRTLAEYEPNGTVNVRGVHTNSPVRAFACDPYDPATQPIVTLDSAASLLACADGASTDVLLHDVSTERFLGRLVADPEEVGPVSHLQFAPGNRELVVHHGHFLDISQGIAGAALTVWNVSDLSLLATLPHNMPRVGMDFTADGSFIAVSDIRDVVLWDMATMSERLRFVDGHELNVRFVDLSSDGKTLVSGSDDRIVFWDVGSGDQLGGPLPAPDSFLQGLRLSPDDTTLAAPGVAGTFLWDVGTRQPLGQMAGIRFIEFSPDGRHLIAFHGQDIVEVNLDADQWRQIACDVANRNLTEAEWELYLGSEPYRETCR